MRSLAISGVALAALLASGPAWAHNDSRVGAPVTAPDALGNTDMRVPSTVVPDALGNTDMRMPDVVPPPPPPPVVRNAARRIDQRPSYGFQLPQAWMSSAYFISDYRAFGLDRPARGFGWSRYHDDIVLSDQWGRVYDVARRDDRDAVDRHPDTAGLTGGVAGAAIGAVAGNVIAGAGSRLAGSLIGGGVGALAGLAIEVATSKHRRGGRPHGRHRDEEFHYSHGAHWGGYPAQVWSHGCNCGSDGAVVTTTVTHHGGGYLVPQQIVTYENVYAAAPAKYRVRAAAPAAAPAKIRTRTRLHTKTY